MKASFPIWVELEGLPNFLGYHLPIKFTVRHDLATWFNKPAEFSQASGAPPFVWLANNGIRSPLGEVVKESDYELFNTEYGAVRWVDQKLERDNVYGLCRNYTVCRYGFVRTLAPRPKAEREFNELIGNVDHDAEGFED